MRKCLLLIVVLLAFVSKAHSGDLVKVADVSICKGQTATLDIVLNNPDNQYTAIQADLYLPDGIEIEKNEDSFVFELNRITDSHSLSIGAMSGYYRLILSSSMNKEITGSDGKVISLSLKARADLENGSMNCILKKVKLARKDGMGIVIDEIPFSIIVQDMIIVTAKSYNRVYGEANPTFEFTTSESAITGTPEISCEATATSPVGTYDIIISKGSVINNNVTYVNGTLTITKAPLTITAKDYTIKQGEALPSFEATYEGFKNSETSAVLTMQPMITTTATSASEPGEYDITVSGAESKNYEITYVKGKLTITQADALTVTAKSYTIAYGDDIPKFEYTSEGATISGTPTITCEAKKCSPVGSYDIIISKGTVTNYNDTYVNGTLTIKKAPLTITAKDYTIKQGEALPTFEATYEGFKNNETAAVLTKQPTITTTATSASEPGDYEITVSGAEAQNYEISYVNGKLTVTEADALIVTAKSYSIEYGDEIPTFEYTSEGATISGTPTITCEAKKGSPVGTYDIIISKGSVTNNNDTYVNGTLTITKAPLKIGVKDIVVKQGDKMPDFELTYDGFKNGETENVLTSKPSVAATGNPLSDLGEYDILLMGGEAENYVISLVKGKLTVVKADALIVTANNYTIEYGDEIPAFEYTCDGTTLSGTPSITCEAKKGSPVGTYEIIISKGTVTNYNDTYVNGTLTITKAPLTITAKDYIIKQGEALPTFEATYEGFKNSETSAVLTKQPIITTTATSGSDIGDYDITVSGAEAQNYEISYAKGKLTIEAPEIIPGDANDDSKVNATDIMDIVNHMMGKPTSTGKFNEQAADANGDGTVNATDIVKIVNIITGN